MNSTQQVKPDSYAFTIPPRLYTVPFGAVLLGMVVGVNRGARLASLRFLAENAHRTPTTQKGWYYYHKTKNYRVILGALQGAARDAAYLGTTTVAWVGLEEGFNRMGWGRVGMTGAGVGTAGLFCGLYRLGRKTAVQIIVLGFIGGAVMDGLDFWIEDRSAKGYSEEDKLAV